MSFIGAAILGSAAIGAGASVYGGIQQSNALSNASGNIAGGQQNALAALQKYLGPYAQFGQGLQQTLQSLLPPGPNQPATLKQLPGFQFASDMANWGVQAGAGKTGISGTTAVDGGNLQSALASQYFSNFTNPLVQLYGQSAGAAGQLGQGAAGIYTGGAQAQAQLAVGQGNVQAGMAGGVAGSLQNALLMGALTGAWKPAASPYPTAPQAPIPYTNSPWSGGQ